MEHLRKKLQGPVHFEDLDRIEVPAVTSSSLIHHAILADARVSNACGWPLLGAEAEQAAGGRGNQPHAEISNHEGIRRIQIGMFPFSRLVKWLM